MANILNASTSPVPGLITSSDGSNSIELQSDGVTKLTVSSSGVGLSSALPISSGGTGSTSTTYCNLTSNVTGTLPVANGGTGATSLTANNVLLGNGTSALQTVAPGTSGNVLVSNGTTWTSAAPAGGGAWIYLSTVTASNSADAVFESINSTYNVYAIVCTGFYMATEGYRAAMRVKIGSTYSESLIYFGSGFYNQANTLTITGSGLGNGIEQLYITPIVGNYSSYPANYSFIMYLMNFSNTNIYKTVMFNANDATSISRATFATGMIQTTSAITGVKFFSMVGNIYGTFRFYGIKNS